MARLRREIKKTDKFQRVNRREEGRGKREEMKVRVGVFKGERREHVGSTSAVDFGMR
jgi:hypothetical protein